MKNLANWKVRAGDGESLAASVEDASSGSPTDFYFVRVTQADGELAWSSPVWVDWEG